MTRVRHFSRFSRSGPPNGRPDSRPSRIQELAARAISGWRRYGMGRHQAALNFGDCFTYALAERTGYPVLCTGDDFAATGISVLRPPAGNGEP